MSKYCPNCGEKINDSSAFCPYCGQKVDRDYGQPYDEDSATTQTQSSSDEYYFYNPNEREDEDRTNDRAQKSSGFSNDRSQFASENDFKYRSNQNSRYNSDYDSQYDSGRNSEYGSGYNSEYDPGSDSAPSGSEKKGKLILWLSLGAAAAAAVLVVGVFHYLNGRSNGSGTGSDQMVSGSGAATGSTSVILSSGGSTLDADPVSQEEKPASSGTTEKTASSCTTEKAGETADSDADTTTVSNTYVYNTTTVNNTYVGYVFDEPFTVYANVNEYLTVWDTSDRHAELTRVKPDAALRVYGRLNELYYVQVISTGDYGWVNSVYTKMSLSGGSSAGSDTTYTTFDQPFTVYANVNEYLSVWDTYTRNKELTRVKPDTEFRVYGQANELYYVEIVSTGQKGWVNSVYTKSTRSGNSGSSGSSSSYTRFDEPFTVYANVNEYLSVWDTATRNKELVRVAPNTEFTVYGQTNELYYVEIVSTGQKGWVNSKYTKTSSGSSSSSGSYTAYDEPFTVYANVKEYLSVWDTSSRHAELTRVKPNTEFRVYGKTNELYYVEIVSTGQMGWVNSVYTKTSSGSSQNNGSGMSQPSDEPETEFDEPFTVYADVNEYLSVWDTSSRHAELTRVKPNTEFLVYGKTNELYYVEIVSTGQMGWVNSKYTKTSSGSSSGSSSSSSSEPDTVYDEPFTVYANVKEYLSVWDTSSRHAELTRVKPNTEFLVYGKTNELYYVEIVSTGQMGWVNSKYTK